MLRGGWWREEVEVEGEVSIGKELGKWKRARTGWVGVLGGAEGGLPGGWG